VENIDKLDKEKVEEESKLALVEVQVVTEITAREEVGSNKEVDDEYMEEEPAKMSPQQAMSQEIAAKKKVCHGVSLNVV
jgi:hypothetical protein